MYMSIKTQVNEISLYKLSITVSKKIKSKLQKLKVYNLTFI